MIRNRAGKYLISGILLAYFAWDGDFVIWYNGIALALSVTAFVIAYLEYKKQKSS